jgi:HEAT repeat protein
MLLTQAPFSSASTRRHRSVTLFAQLLLLAILALAPALAASAQNPVDDPAADQMRQREMDYLLGDLQDSRLELDRRRRAAVLLIDRDWSKATAALVRHLGTTGDPLTQRAIAQAVVETGVAPPPFLGPLMKLLESSDKDVRNDVAAALGRFDEPSLSQRLINLATNASADESARLGAIRALAEHRIAPVVQVLLQLAESQSPALRQAAVESLTLLSGLNYLGPDVAAWRRWWQRMAPLPPYRWQAALTRNLSARNLDAARQVANLTDRLLTTYAQLYDGAAEPARAQVLGQMLIDPLESVRLLALKLIERRILNAQDVADEVRAAMRLRLADDSPLVRARCALLLEDLADAPGARIAADMLASEPSPEVQAALMTLLARVTLADAIEPAMQLMSRPALRSSAMNLIAAAYDASKLRDDQAARALDILRRDLAGTDKPDPMALRLLGRLASPEDLPLLVGYLTNADTPIRLAAAEALAAEKWPIDPLLDHLNDETLGPVVIQIVGRRGQRLPTLMRLLENEPADAEARVIWQEAVLAVAGRLDNDGLVGIHIALLDQPARRDLHEAILKAAAATTAISVTPEAAARFETRRTEAEFLLASLYLVNGQPAKARPVVDRLVTRETITTDQRRRLDLLRLRTMLSQLQTEESASLTSRLLTDPAAPSADVLWTAWFDAIDRAITTGEAAAARSMADRAALLFTEKFDAPAAKRLADLKQKLPPAPSTPPPAPSTLPPVPTVIPTPPPAPTSPAPARAPAE